MSTPNSPYEVCARPWPVGRPRIFAPWAWRVAPPPCLLKGGFSHHDAHAERRRYVYGFTAVPYHTVFLCLSICLSVCPVYSWVLHSQSYFTLRLYPVNPGAVEPAWN